MKIQFVDKVSSWAEALTMALEWFDAEELEPWKEDASVS